MVKVKEEISLEDVKKEMLEFCLRAQCRAAILDYILVARISVVGTAVHYTKYIKQLLAQRYLKTNFKDKRSARQEKYVTTQKGLNYLKAIAY